MVAPHRRQRKSAARLSLRSLRVEQLETRCLLDGGGAQLADDFFDLWQNGPPTALDLLANDQFAAEYEQPRLITSVSYGSEGGRIEIGTGGHDVLYTPPADFFGTESFVYAVDSEFTAHVFVTMQAALEFDHFEIPPDGVTRQLDVLDNDSFWPGYAGPRRITSVSVGSAGGTVEIGANAQTIQYTPPAGAYGKETFVYVVDGIYPAQVTVEIPLTLKSDQYELVQHDPPAMLDVLANDPFWLGYAGPRQITQVTASAVGAKLEISPDGQSIRYQQPDNFSLGYWDSFRYVVDDTYEANVSVVLHRPVRDDYFEVDENSSDYFFNVTLNDTYRDLDNRVHDVIDRVTSVTESEQGGSISIVAGGEGILYTPAAGLTGSDTFTYLADGLHEATVRVQVTRPVRDDYLFAGIFQDTPGNVVDVLANDFLGNGYVGARVISAVGPTGQGGIATLRSDGRAILYTPAPGYTGQDSFSYTVDGALQAVATVNVRALAQHDSVTFCADPGHGAYPIAVLANDHFEQGYPGPGRITGVEVVSGSGQAALAGAATVLFTADQSGFHQLRYTVDGRYEADVSVWIPSHLAPDQLVVDQNSAAQSLHVLANDFQPDPSYVSCPSQHYRGDRVVTGVTPSQQGGTVTVGGDGHSVHYTPPTDFVGADSFSYSVDNFLTETVSVEVIRRVRDDLFRVDAADGSQPLPVLVNDLFGADYAGVGQITHVSATSSDGDAVIAQDGRSIVYTPAAGFVGTDTFTYTVDGALKAAVNIVVDVAADDRLPTFENMQSYHQFLIDDALERYQYLFGTTAWNFDLFPTEQTNLDFNGATPNRNHSETNVQVAGVDEGDIVEFDADYLYLLTDDEVVIVDAWPAAELQVASRLPIAGRPLVEYLHGDRLTVISEIGGGWIDPPWDFGGDAGLVDLGLGDFGLVDVEGVDRWGPPLFEPLPYSTIITVIDVSDRVHPSVVQTTSLEGRHIDSRGVGDYVYLLVNNDDAVAPPPQIIADDDNPMTPGSYETAAEYLARVTANSGQFIEGALPNYTSYGPDGEMVRTGLLNLPADIYRPLVPEAMNLISVVSLNVAADEPGLAATSAVYSTGASTIYASLHNFYVFDGDTSAEDGAVTRIVKFAWDPATGGVEFAATTTVAGSILNQFSADEYGDTLRIATTASNRYAGNWSGRDENLLFVLQEDSGVLESVGSLQNLALNETMRSVRFLGDRAFVTTFRSIDPLFAFDLTDATRPRSVGHITLPGFTSYMQLIDQNHLLTIGRNTPGGASGPTQVSLFDIADLTQPWRIAEYTFPRFSTSEAELDHHAFGYYAEHGLLAMPVASQYVERIDDDGDGYREASRWVREDRLALFAVDVAASAAAQRLELVSEIEHHSPVRRSGYIGDKLYSVANDAVKVVAVADPATVLAELIVAADSDLGGGPDPALELQLDVAGAAVPVSDYPAAHGNDVFFATIARARADLANRLGLPAAAPLVVTVEAASPGQGGGLKLVFQVGDTLAAYRSNDDGLVQPLPGDFEFPTGAGAWHSVAAVTVAPPTILPGNYDLDSDVDGADFLRWQRSLGSTTDLSADGNRSGLIEGGDLTSWERRFGGAGAWLAILPGDYDLDGTVTGSDFLKWQRSPLSTTDLATDGHGERVVDAGDLTVWQAAFGAGTTPAAPLPGDYEVDARVDGADFLNWQRALNSTTDLAADGNRNHVVDAGDLAIWEANLAAATAPAAAIPASSLTPDLVDAAMALATRELATLRDNQAAAEPSEAIALVAQYRSQQAAVGGTASRVIPRSPWRRAASRQRGDVSEFEFSVTVERTSASLDDASSAAI